MPLLWLGAVAACASPPATGDTAVQDAAEAGPAIDAGDGGDASDGAVATDARACQDVSGAYEWRGTCPGTRLFVPPLTCIAQTGCDAINLAFAQQASGTVAGNVLTTRYSDGLSAMTCTITVTGDAATQHCETTDPPGACDLTGVRATFPGAASYCCRPGAASCGAGQRCQPLGSTAVPAQAYTGCVPAGAIAEGGACVRAMNGRIGADDCGAGLTCANFGQPSVAQRICQRLCADARDCRTGEVCVSLSNNVVQAGLCRPACALFGSDCGPGLTCRTTVGWEAMHEGLDPPSLVESCWQVGSTPDGASCSALTDCGANSDCQGVDAGTTICVPNCDATHPCPAGSRCTLRDGISPNPANASYCQPRS